MKAPAIVYRETAQPEKGDEGDWKGADTDWVNLGDGPPKQEAAGAPTKTEQEWGMSMQSAVDMNAAAPSWGAAPKREMDEPMKREFAREPESRATWGTTPVVEEAPIAPTWGVSAAGGTPGQSSGAGGA